MCIYICVCVCVYMRVYVCVYHCVCVCVFPFIEDQVPVLAMEYFLAGGNFIDSLFQSHDFIDKKLRPREIYIVNC